MPEVTIVDRHVDLVSERFDVGLLLSQRISTNTLVTRPLMRLTFRARPRFSSTTWRSISSDEKEIQSRTFFASTTGAVDNPAARRAPHAN